MRRTLPFIVLCTLTAALLSGCSLNHKEAAEQAPVSKSTITASSSKIEQQENAGSASSESDSQETGVVKVREESYFLNDQVGWKASYSAYGMFREDTVLYRTTDGGQTWTEIASSNKEDSTLPGGMKSGIVFTSESDGWMTTNAPWDGRVGLYTTHDGGSTWQEEAVTVPETLQSTQLYVYPPKFASADEGILIIRPVAASSLLYITDDGGAHWTPIIDEQQGSHNEISWALSDDGLYTIVMNHEKWILHTSGDGTWGQI
ncbi:WD40/YVTN/BNR-like repeat-containing protein [Paenibacillus kobensis]|uniref:WD40/YVTN/BNR-like repeat-containing protein n=1 Tax=Paenibacillus kobensis TaxID=59841 RepID=UPI000FDBED79|nr:hypothetical protein [Paenibacillus kobensis]